MNWTPYFQECEEMASFARSEEKNLTEVLSQAEQNVTRIEYGRGGEMMHRGYYCPSKVSDICIGNIKRGRILKKLATNSKPSYLYGFNSKNKLILVTRVHEVGNTYEVIRRQGNIELGIIFSQSLDIEAISKCVFDDGRLQSYTFYHYAFYNSRVSGFDKEVYEYSDDSLLVDVKNFSCWQSTNEASQLGLLQKPYVLEPILIHNQYLFRNENGFLGSYTVKEFDGETPKASYWDSHVFDHQIKREI